MLAGTTRWELAPCRGATLHLNRRPFDRPVIAYGGKTINSLRLWGAAAHHYFDFQEFSH
jgi:starch phosphorylase